MCDKVSIIVPVFNAEQYLKPCIDSILSQTYEDIEVILVDDGSSDRSSELCSYYAEKDIRVMVIHKSNGGVSAARESGSEIASGKYIMMVDADDWIDNNTVEECVKYFHKTKSECIMFSYVKEYPKNKTEVKLFQKNCTFIDEEVVNIHRGLFGLTGNELRNPRLQNKFTSIWGKMYRRDIFKSGRFFNLSEIGSCEDGLFNIYALNNCKKLSYIDKPFYHYRKTTGSQTSIYRPMLHCQWERLFFYMNEFILNEGKAQEYKAALKNRVALSVFGIGMNDALKESGSLVWLSEQVKRYINREYVRDAVCELDTSSMPLVWKFFFGCCKKKVYLLIAIQLRAMIWLKRVI